VQLLLEMPLHNLLRSAALQGRIPLAAERRTSQRRLGKKCDGSTSLSGSRERPDASQGAAGNGRHPTAATSGVGDLPIGAVAAVENAPAYSYLVMARAVPVVHQHAAERVRLNFIENAAVGKRLYGDRGFFLPARLYWVRAGINDPSLSAGVIVIATVVAAATASAGASQTNEAA